MSATSSPMGRTAGAQKAAGGLGAGGGGATLGNRSKGLVVVHTVLVATFRCAASDTRKPAAYAAIRMVRCLRLAIESRKCITSSGLKITGSLNGFLGIGVSSGAQFCLSVTRYRNRSAAVAVPTLLAAR